jgi:hypothetical protein
MVTFNLTVPSTRSFCDPVLGCNTNTHFLIGIAPGNWLTTSPGWCQTQCSNECAPPPCPGIFCGETGTGVPVTEVQWSWDGRYILQSTCGNAIPCYWQRYVAPGRYVVRMCATPGTLATTDAGLQACTATGPSECVDVPFDMPGPSPVVGALPP